MMCTLLTYLLEEGEILENPTKTKNYIADFYENLYQAKGQPQYTKWTDLIKN